MPDPTSPLLQAMSKRVLVLDGAMGSTLQSMDLEIERDYLGHENCVDLLVRSRPELVQGLHEGFLEAGADAVETDTFGANRHVLAEFDPVLADWTRSLNREAAEVARAACDRFATPDRPRFVLGSMGPGTRLVTLGQIGWDEMVASYAEQARGLVEGGADAFLIETCQDLLQVKCAVNGCLVALDAAGRTPQDIPIMVSVTIETTGTMLLGSEIAAVVAALAPFPIATLGLNCATGPREMAEHVDYLSRHWHGPITIVPNAGLPVLENGKTCFPLEPDEFADTLAGFVDRYGVALVGGCCGTSVDHIRRLAERVAGQTPAARSPERGCGACTSLYRPIEYRQENAFLMVGERMNASGSRRFKRLLEEENWDEIISTGREQVREGAHVLDLNVDYAGRDNARDMGEIVSRTVRQVDAPLMIDSTQVATLEAGLRHAGGKCIINSANFEDGDEKFDAICTLARRYGAAVVIGTIDEDEEAAMARTADRKFEIAARAYERAVSRHGLDPRDIFFDPLVLPVSTGMDSDRRSALELVEGTRRIAQAFPEAQITCGLSNVSFGLKPMARAVLNSVLMDLLVQAGMTSAIVHVSKILPLARIPDEQRAAALDLIHDRRATERGGTGLPAGVEDETFDPLQAFIDLFDDAAVDTSEQASSRAERTLDQVLRDHIIDGEQRELEADLDRALEQWTPLEIINDHLLDGMRVVGELFGSGQMQLPFVLQSAEVMKRAVDYLEPHMERASGSTKGTIVLATVKGDVHDIGKNLVDIILTNNGYTVHNLGIKQPIGRIVEAFRETSADAIGMSGLLVKSVVVMEENLRELNAMGVNAPVLLGGAALSRHYAESQLRSTYEGPLHYGRDAFDGLRICDAIMSGRGAELDAEVEARLAKRAETEQRVAAARSVEAPPAAAAAVASAVRTDVPVPAPPFWGDRLVESVDLATVYEHINTVALFRGQWGLKKGSMSEAAYARHLAEHAEPVFERLKAECMDDGILQPQVVYGWFPCQRDGDDLVIGDPRSPERLEEVERFRFPRQSGRKHLCLSDYFRNGSVGACDIVGFMCVTVGPEVSVRARELFEADRYSEYLYLHGLGVESAEGLAELWHRRMRAELGIDGDDGPTVRDLFAQRYRGARYSFGYPACPEMSDQEKLFRLLRPDRIGCVLTENWQIDPEQSTSALIVHHPEAKYFAV